jgi:hypothetical protein
VAAGDGDIIQLRDASATHVHALGHKSSVGADWTALPSPKLNHQNAASSGDAIYVCPGSSISDYGTNSPQDGTTYTTKNSSTLTFGLPNTCGASSTANPLYWRGLREPQFTTQTPIPTYSSGSISFSWTGATDPNPSDGTMGYIILRKYFTFFYDPS